MRFEYDEEAKGKNPFWIEKLTPIQIAAFDLAEYQRLRGEFTTEEWIDLMLRSMERRRKPARPEEKRSCLAVDPHPGRRQVGPDQGSAGHAVAGRR